MTVTLTAEQWQIVERALIELPFRIAQPIIESLVNQFNLQIESKEAEIAQ